MLMFSDDLEYLVNETMNHKVFNSEFLFTEPFDLSSESDPHVNQVIDEIPNCPGLIYNIQKNSTSFLIRSFIATDLCDVLESVRKTPEDYPKLRLIVDGEPNFSNLKYIETETHDQAKVIQKEISNKRFPFNEEHFCNISDPGFTWWLKEEENSFEILFSLSHTHDMSNMIKIGPLGDTAVATKRFREFYFFFSTIFPIADYSVGRSHFKISALPNKPGLFRDLMNLFKTGEVTIELVLRLEEVERLLKEQQINSFTAAKDYLLELAAVRRLWDKIQDELVSIS
jgi:hypothetical protein